MLREVEALLERGRAVGAKPLKEYLEVKGYGDAAKFVYAQATNPGDDWASNELLNLATGRHVHHLAMSPVWQVAPHLDATDRETPGNFREHDIHPFIDGNGRTGRLLLNLFLVRLGYPPVIVLKTQRAQYLSAMQKADTDDYGPLAEILARAMYDNLNRFLLPTSLAPPVWSRWQRSWTRTSAWPPCDRLRSVSGWTQYRSPTGSGAAAVGRSTHTAGPRAPGDPAPEPQAARMSILPVTAAEIRAERRPLSAKTSARHSPTTASILVVCSSRYSMISSQGRSLLCQRFPTRPSTSPRVIVVSPLPERARSQAVTSSPPPSHRSLVPLPCLPPARLP
ncbi:MAG: Fic family protein [Marmoricola sp.]